MDVIAILYSSPQTQPDVKFKVEIVFRFSMSIPNVATDKLQIYFQITQHWFLIENSKLVATHIQMHIL